ncbi:MAG: hypothetical protein JXB88_04250 [Spirochaetales bacterium]|nr:hypothetical protein [Spirochaetales bacterium]
MKNIDWLAIADKLNIDKIYSSEHAKRALELIIGEEAIVSAVDYYIDLKQHSELARLVLSIITPISAMNRCYQIYINDDNIERKRTAIELLRIISDKSVLKWVHEFLKNNDESIQIWGAGIVDYLIFRNIVDIDECKSELETMKQHKNEHVRELYKSIMGNIK